MQEWADEIRRSDERCEHFRNQYELLNKRKQDVEVHFSHLEQKIAKRDEEIKRLHQLYEGGQNLEKLNMRYLQDTNEKTIQKLQNQVDFMNKENHRL